MGLGNCDRCGNPMFPDLEVQRRLEWGPYLQQLARTCVCKPRSLWREVACVAGGHRWRGRVRLNPVADGTLSFWDCTRCGRVESCNTPDGFRRRAEDLFILVEHRVNHPEWSDSWEARFPWLCDLADWITGGRCHD